MSECIPARQLETAPLDSLETLIALAANQPTAELDYGGSVPHIQFGDNFFRRFPDLRAVRQETANDEQVFYVRMVKERFGLDLLTFYDEHVGLCETICGAIEDKDPYDRLLSGQAQVRELEMAGQLSQGSAAALDRAVGHPLGIEAIGIYYWERINPLLEQAYLLLEPRTLNAPFLTR